MMIGGKYMNNENIQSSKLLDVNKVKIDRKKSKKMTGFTSIDRPYESDASFFKKHPIIPDLSIYDAVIAMSLPYRKEKAINCYELTATYNELIKDSRILSKGLKELVDEMNDGSVQVVAAGGADGGRIGTSAIKIQQAIESVEDCGHILIYADLGSSILSAETAMDLIDEDLAEKVQIVDAPIVEGALAGVVQGTISDDVADVIKASEDARNVHKN